MAKLPDRAAEFAGAMTGLVNATFSTEATFEVVNQPASICANKPPVECPITTGFFSKALTISEV